MTKQIFSLFLNVKLLIDYYLCSVMTILKIFDIFNIIIVSNYIINLLINSFFYLFIAIIIYLIIDTYIILHIIVGYS